MFSCCALFSADDASGVDTEHLKGLDEVNMAPVGDREGLSTASSCGGRTALGSRGLTEPSPASRTLDSRLSEVSSLNDEVEHAASQAIAEEAVARNVESDAIAAEAAAKRASREAEASVATAEQARVAAQTEADRAGAEKADQTLKALREAEDAAHAAAAEAEKRRFEEEASARAARQAESEARKALWLAEEAQKAAIAHQKQVAKITEDARQSLMRRMSDGEGLKLQKHGRNGKTTVRQLRLSDDGPLKITWGRESYDIRTMQEVRRGTDPDPAASGYTGTAALRRAKKGAAQLDRSFSLLFPERSLDFTVDTQEGCEELVAGFRALSAHKS